ncbi:MAG: efflux RND transporter periplasmic adaptor subunit [Planctomycetota bacterium]
MTAREPEPAAPAPAPGSGPEPVLAAPAAAVPAGAPSAGRGAGLAVSLVLVGLAGWWVVGSGGAGGSPGGGAEAEDAAPETSAVVPVTAAPLRREALHPTLHAFGPVVAAVGESLTVSLPYEARVRRVLVAAGQVVAADTPLLEVEPSPDALLQLEVARSEREQARDALALVRRRLELELATRQDLLLAERQLQAAELRVASLEQRGSGAPRLVQAQGPGIVCRVAVLQGALVPAGAPLVETTGERQVDVCLGIEVDEVEQVRVGQAVELRPVNGPAGRAARGRVRLITRRVNPQTRLVDVFVTPDQAARLLLDEYVEGRLALADHLGLVAPRAAVVADEEGFAVFTVEGGHAVRHRVRLGLEQEDRVELAGGGLAPDQAVVVVGAAEVQDGIAVRVSPESTAGSGR